MFRYCSAPLFLYSSLELCHLVIKMNVSLKASFQFNNQLVESDKSTDPTFAFLERKANKEK